MLSKYSCFVVCLLVSLELVAQVTPPPPTPPPPPGLPVNGGLVLLCGVAVLFGFYKIYISVFKKKRSI